MTEMEASKYNPTYLLKRGYKCFRQKAGAPYWEPKVEVEYKAFISSMPQPNGLDCFNYFFNKGSIEIRYGLLIHGHPPKVTRIDIGNKNIFLLWH